MQPAHRAELFHQAAALPPVERERCLVEQYAADPALAREVESLLVSFEAGLGFLEQTGSEGQPRGRGPGSHLGPYELVEEIALGGMGTVWRARRVGGAFEKQVAIKLIQHAPLRPRPSSGARTDRAVIRRHHGWGASSSFVSSATTTYAQDRQFTCGQRRGGSASPSPELRQPSTRPARRSRSTPRSCRSSLDSAAVLAPSPALVLNASEPTNQGVSAEPLTIGS